MQTLELALHDQDLGHLRIIASLWGFEPPGGSTAEAAVRLARAMRDPALLIEIVDTLPAPAQEAFKALQQHQGRLPLADLTRNYGPLRKMGPGRRDREQPWRNRTSPLEALWYRGLIARTFLDTPTGPQEFGFIPSDLAALLPPAEAAPEALALKPVAPPELLQLAGDGAVDDLVTLLAALRRRPMTSSAFSRERLQGLQPYLQQPASGPLLLACLSEQRLLSGDQRAPEPEAVRALLDLPRAEILLRLQDTWRNTDRWNDLAQVPHLRSAGGQWPNEPLISRRAILELLAGLKAGEWWDLSEFILAVHDTRPAFQRPAGDFDSWYLQDSRTGSFLRGIAHWHAVEGTLIHTVITGPMHWLGMIDLGRGGTEGPPTSFRLAQRSALSPEPDAASATKSTGPTPPTQVRPDGLIVVPRQGALALRYQIARICAWEMRDADAYRYRLTPDGLALASSQGLQASHIRTILEGASGSPLPPPMIRALERWSAGGTQARLERTLVFTVTDPELLKELHAHRSTARYLREQLGPKAASVAERDWRRLCEAAARAGILIEPPGPVGDDAP